MDDIVFPKWILYSLVTGLVGVLCALFNYTNGSYIDIPKVSVIFYLVLFSFCIIYFKKEYSNLWLLVSLSSCILLYTIFILFKEDKNLDFVFKISIYIICIYLLYVGMYQYCTGKQTINGTYDNNVGLSLTLLISFVFLTNDLISFSIKLKNIVFFVFSISIIIFLFICHSRIGLISILLYSIFFIGSRLKWIIMVLILLMLCSLFVNKSDSTKGRYFIYHTTISMLDSPRRILFGRGVEGFRNHYMEYQEKQLSFVNKEQKKLADNIKQPLSDILLFIVNYGIISGFIILGLICYLLCNSKLSKLNQGLLIVLLIYSLFSYPFRYPISWIVASYTCANLAISSKKYIRLKRNAILFPVICFGVFLCCFSLLITQWNYNWKRAYDDIWYKSSYLGLNKFDALSNSFFANSEFYYNYSASLLYKGEYAKSLYAINKCKIIDYDTQLLKGEIYFKLKDCKKALLCYYQALGMCPNRFMPLYGIYLVYEQEKNTFMLNKIGREILYKEVKVPSKEIDMIKKYITNNK